MKITLFLLHSLTEENYAWEKSDLLSVLPEGNDKVVPVSFDFKVLDGAAIVHLL